jgi:hypothetical protein
MNIAIMAHLVDMIEEALVQRPGDFDDEVHAQLQRVVDVARDRDDPEASDEELAGLEQVVGAFVRQGLHKKLGAVEGEKAFDALMDSNGEAELDKLRAAFGGLGPTGPLG